MRPLQCVVLNISRQHSHLNQRVSVTEWPFSGQKTQREAEKAKKAEYSADAAGSAGAVKAGGSDSTDAEDYW